jgi:hypothetical protein
MEHVYLKHVACEEAMCAICDGGLALCTVCGGAEGSLTTECPGRKVTSAEDEAVYACTLDYFAGQWFDCTRRVKAKAK